MKPPSCLAARLWLVVVLLVASPVVAQADPLTDATKAMLDYFEAVKARLEIYASSHEHQRILGALAILSCRLSSLEDQIRDYVHLMENGTVEGRAPLLKSIRETLNLVTYDFRTLKLFIRSKDAPGRVTADELERAQKMGRMELEVFERDDLPDFIISAQHRELVDDLERAQTSNGSWVESRSAKTMGSANLIDLGNATADGLKTANDSLVDLITKLGGLLPACSG